MEEDWTPVLPRTKLGPHRRHFFQLQNVRGKQYTHVRLTIYPDGGIKRIRILGKLANNEGIPDSSGTVGKAVLVETKPGFSASRLEPESSSTVNGSVIPALPLTPEAFAAFGQVIQAWADVNATPKAIKVTPANQGSATKFHKLSLLDSSYPPGLSATTGLSVYRCKHLPIRLGEEWAVRVLERHPYTNQAFIPMGTGASLSDQLLETQGRAYLVVVATNGDDDKPDLETLRAFVAHTGQGIVYNRGVWRKSAICILRSEGLKIESRSSHGDSRDREPELA